MLGVQVVVAAGELDELGALQPRSSLRRLGVPAACHEQQHRALHERVQLTRAVRRQAVHDRAVSLAAQPRRPTAVDVHSHVAERRLDRFVRPAVVIRPQASA
ncbi:MAG TPA: hypothetical protein VGE11_02125 [Pseudonocardia sp.]